MCPAVGFVVVDDGKNLIKVFFRVLCIMYQLIVEPQNLSSQKGSIALIIGLDVFIKAAF